MRLQRQQGQPVIGTVVDQARLGPCVFPAGGVLPAHAHRTGIRAVGEFDRAEQLDLRARTFGAHELVGGRLRLGGRGEEDEGGERGRGGGEAGGPRDDHAASRGGRSELRGEAGRDGGAGRARTQGAEGLLEVVVGISHGCGR